MAGNRVEYIIDLVANDKQLRTQMAKLNWEEIMGWSKGKGFKDALLKDTKSAKEEIANTLGNMGFDWGKMLGEKEFGLLEKKVGSMVVANKKKLLAFASEGDVTGMQNTIDLVSALGQELKGLGSDFDASGVARNIGSFWKVLSDNKVSKTTADVSEFLNTYSELLSKTGSSGANNNIVTPKVNFTQANNEIDLIQRKINNLNDTAANISIKTTDTSNIRDMYKEVESIANKIPQIQEKIDTLQWDMDEPGISKEKERKIMMKQATQYEALGTLYRQLDKIRQVKPLNMSKIMGDLGLDIDPQAELQNVISKMGNIKQILSENVKTGAGQGAQEIGIEIRLPTTEDVRSRINSIISELNSPGSLHKIRLEIDDDFANVIADRQKRAYKDNPADYDANTTELVKKTEARFDRIAGVIDDKLNGEDGIVAKTTKWRNNMLEQFKFKSGDFDFKFNDTLIESLQSLFDDYSLKINIDPQYLANQIKTVLSDGGVSLGGGTANIDANSMTTVVNTVLRSVLTGEMPQVPISSGNVDDSNNLPEEVSHITTEIEQTGRHLDLAEDYVKDVVEKLKAVAKYATRHMGTDKDTKGAIATREIFSSLGGVVKDELGNVVKDNNGKPMPILDLQKVKTASDTEIVSMLENSLLQKDEFGKLKGSTVIDELSNFKGSSSKTISAFLKSMDEVFFMLQENTQTVEEWTRKRGSKETFDWARDRAKAASGLRDVRSTIRQGDIPNIQSIETAISLMSAIGQNTDDLQTLKSARETLADKTDDTSIEEFKTAADTFYKSSTKTFWNLKEQAEKAFQGTAYLQGKDGKIHSKNISSYKQLASIKDDAVVVDVQVSSSLNNVALGTVKSKNGNRTSQAEEQRLMRDAIQPDYILPKQHEKDILNKKLTYEGFKPQGVSTEVNLDATLESNERRKQSLTAEIQAKEEEKRLLNDEISVLDDRIAELSAKNKTISQKRRDSAREKVSSFETTQQQLSHEIFMLEEKVGNGKTGKEQRVGSLTRGIEEQVKKRTAAEKQLAQLSEVDVERKKKELNTRISELETETPKLQDDLVRAQARYNRAESDRVMAQLDVHKASAALKAIPKTKKNEAARVEAENTLNKAQFALTDATNKVNEASKDVNSVTQSIERNEKQILDLQGQVSETTLESVREEQLNRIRAINNAITSLENEFETLMTRKNAKESSLLQINKALEKSRNAVPLKTERELGLAISERDKLTQQETLADNTIKRDQDELGNLERMNARVQAQKEYSGLLEKSLMLQGSIEKMTADGTDEKALKRKQGELDKVNIKLAEAETKVQALGGFFGQGNEREYSDGERKTYALNELKEIEDDLIVARAQKRVSESRIAKKDREIADLDRWGLGAGVGASELQKVKDRLVTDFKNSDYMKTFSQMYGYKRQLEDAQRLYESSNSLYYKATNKQWDESLSEKEREKWGRIATQAANDTYEAEKRLAGIRQEIASKTNSDVITKLNDLQKRTDNSIRTHMSDTDINDSQRVRDFLWNTKEGQQITTQHQEEEKKVWDGYFESLRQKEKEEVDAFRKTLDGDETLVANVKESLRARLEEEKRILETKHEPIQGNIDRLEADKAMAIEYGGVSDAELLSGKIIEDQINKEIELTKWKEKQIAAQENLNKLKAAGIDHSSEDYKTAKRELTEAEKQVGYYDMLVKNRQKLVQMRYDESQEPTYTDEEKRLHFTNQIVTYGQRIEASLAKQKELSDKIALATGDEKTRLQRQLSIEEANVAKWREKIPIYESKLNKLQTSESQGASSGMLPNGGIVGGLQIDSEGLATEATLRAILEVLGGVPSGDDNYGLGRGKKKTKTQETSKETKESVVQPDWISKMSEEERKSAITSINKYDKENMNKWKQMNASELADVIQKTTQSMDGLNKESIEYTQKQRELGRLLNIYKDKSDFKDSASVTRKNGSVYVNPKVVAEQDPLISSLGLYDKYSPITGDRAVRDMFAMPKQDTTTESKVEESETAQIKTFDEFKQVLITFREMIEAEKANSEGQRQLQAGFIETLRAWAKTEASGLEGKSLNAKQWEAYLTGTGIFDKIDTSLTPLTNTQLKKVAKVQDDTSEKPKKETKTDKKTEPRTESKQRETVQATGGLIQIVNRLATENTLLQVLNALQALGNVKGDYTSPTAAGDLYNQLKALLFGSSIDDHERLAFMNSESGIVSGNVIGNIANISEQLISALRVKYPNAKGFDTQIHTHGKSETPYFSEEDYQHFTKDYEEGFKKQVLLTKDNISVLDMSAVKSAEEVQNLMNELIRAGDNAEAIRKVFESDTSGAMFETAKFSSLDAKSLVGMLGTQDTDTEIDSYVSGLQNARDKMQKAIDVGYLSDKDTNLSQFDTILNRVREIADGIKNGTMSYESQRSELEELINSATMYNDIVSKTVSMNKRAYAGVGTVDSVNKQRNRIIGMFGDESSFNASNIALIQQYNAAVRDLNGTYEHLASSRKIQDKEEQQRLEQQAFRVQSLGKYLMSNINQAQQLQHYVDQSGGFIQNGGLVPLSGKKEGVTSEELDNLEATMRTYAYDTLGHANMESAKFNSIKQQLFYTIRTGKDSVADMAIQYNAATNALYAYNVQERESLTGLRAFMHQIGAKTRSLLQYTTSITSIYRIWAVIRQGVQYVKDIDSALTELKKVTDETEASYSKFIDTASQTADKVGSTIKDVISSTADWARLGYTIEDAHKLAETTQVLMNVSEFDNVSTATDSLISSIQAFKYTAEESMDVVDILNTIGKQNCRCA